MKSLTFSTSMVRRLATLPLWPPVPPQGANTPQHPCVFSLYFSFAVYYTMRRDQVLVMGNQSFLMGVAIRNDSVPDVYTMLRVDPSLAAISLRDRAMIGPTTSQVGRPDAVLGQVSQQAEGRDAPFASLMPALFGVLPCSVLFSSFPCSPFATGHQNAD